MFDFWVMDEPKFRTFEGRFFGFVRPIIVTIQNLGPDIYKLTFNFLSMVAGLKSQIFGTPNHQKWQLQLKCHKHSTIPLWYPKTQIFILKNSKIKLKSYILSHVAH